MLFVIIVLSLVDVVVTTLVTVMWCHYDVILSMCAVVDNVVVGGVTVMCVWCCPVVLLLLLLFCGCYCCRGGCGHAEEDRSGIRKPPGEWKVSDLDIVLSEPTETWEGPRSPQEGDSNNSESLGGTRETHSVSDRLAAPGSSLLRLHPEVSCIHDSNCLGLSLKLKMKNGLKKTKKGWFQTIQAGVFFAYIWNRWAGENIIESAAVNDLKMFRSWI